MRRRIDIKLGLAILLIFLLVLLPLGFVVDRLFVTFFYNKAHQQVNELAAHYVKMSEAEHGLSPDLLPTMEEFSKSAVYIMNADGELAGTSRHSNQDLSLLITKEDLVQLEREGSIDKEVTDSHRQDYYVSGKSIIVNGQHQGGVFVASSMSEVQQSISSIRRMLTIAGIGGFLLAIGFSTIFARKMSRPLMQMERATRQIAKGKLDTRIEVQSQDEIGTLAIAINEMARDLQHYQDSRNEFIANISHELKTPITYLEGYTDIVLNELYDTEEERQQYLQVIRAEARRINLLINDLFELAKLQEGKEQLYMEAVEICSLTENAILKVAMKAKEQGLAISFRSDLAEVVVNADAARMEQVILNLLYNAIRYTKEGEISVHVTQDEENMSLSISDTGSGIPEEDLPYIFDRFYRVEKSRSRVYGGSGLGLAIVHKWVELHGGNIRVESQLGKGTKFEIKVPLL
ncbi:sensor histidine kinase [Paenibacillus albiflavus]|nr:HAMP domain-containing sensor histidine kinase [Paenibacillus albiflavus]